MPRIRTIIILAMSVACLEGLWIGQAEAQLPVIDAANLSQNTISATEALINTAKWILELTGLPSIALSAASYLEDLQAVAEVISAGQMIVWDVTSLNTQLNSLLALESAPATSVEFAARMAEIRSLVFLVYSYAMRTQTLIRTLLNTITRLTTFVTHVVEAVGNLQMGQTIAQATTQLVSVQAQLQVQTAAFQRAESIDRLTEPFIEESLIRINEHVWSTAP